MTMRRRQWMAVGGSWLIACAGVRSQSRRSRIAFLGGTRGDADAFASMADPFRQGLRDLGHVEGQTVDIDFRWAEGVPERLPGLAAELLQLHPDVLVTAGPRPAMVAKAATTTVPVVALGVDNPVEMGLVAEFARPGGNVTGISAFGSEMIAKRLQLLVDLVPRIRRVAVLMNPATTSRSQLAPVVEGFGRSLGLSIQLVEARSSDEFDAAFVAMEQGRAEGVLVLADATFWTHRSRLHALVAKHRLPSIWGGRAYLDGGGLASYQVDWSAVFRRGAAIVDQVLKGAQPATTPFEQATKLELAVNLKSAQAMGIKVPQSLLVSADHVIR